MVVAPGRALVQTGNKAFMPTHTVVLVPVTSMFLLGKQITVVELLMVNRVPVMKPTAIAPATDGANGPDVPVNPVVLWMVLWTLDLATPPLFPLPRLPHHRCLDNERLGKPNGTLTVRT